MDWSNEDYVRLYTRETTDDLELSWEALAVWHAMLRKFDRSGLMAARNGWSSVARATRIPNEVVARAGAELIRDGRVCAVAGGFLAPNFVEAQTASKSDKSRQRESRDRRRREAYSEVIDSTGTGHGVSQAVTSGHDESRNVTLTVANPLPSDPVAEASRIPPDGGNSTGLTEPRDKIDAATGAAGKHRAQAKAIPEDWAPRSEEREMARSLGLDCDAEAAHFRDHHTAHGTRFKDWNAGFRTWLRNAQKFGGRRRPNNQSALQTALAIANGEA